MARLNARILSYYDKQVTLRKKNILKKLKKNPNASKNELLDLLKDKNDPITVYRLERELGILQGKRLLDDNLRVINIKKISKLIVLSDTIEEKPIRSKIKSGFYEGTNSVEQNRKWLREIIKKEESKLFVLNPDRTLELVKLGLDKSFLKENRISLEQFPLTKDIFSNALYEIKRLSNNKSKNSDWHGFVTFLIEFVFNTSCLGGVTVLDSDEVHWSPETFRNQKLIDYAELGLSDNISTETTLSNWKINSEKINTNDLPIPFFRDVYDVIISILHEATSKNNNDASLSKEVCLNEADSLV